MSDSSKPRRTSAERNKSYKENNPEAVKLNQLRFSVKVSSKRSADSDFDKEYREKEAARKRRYRALAADKSVAATRLAAAINPGPAADAAVTAAVAAATAKAADEDKEKPVQDSQKSRQALVGLLQRRRANKDKNESLGSVMAQKQTFEHKVEELEEEIRLAGQLRGGEIMWSLKERDWGKWWLRI